VLTVAPCTFSNANVIRGDALARYRRLYSEDVIGAAGGEGLVPAVGARLDWDEAGLLAILDDLQDCYDAEPRAFLAAFSGGGLAGYRMVFRHPDRLEAAALVAANFNFWGHGYRGTPGPPPADARRLPVYVLSCERDPLRPARTGPYTLPALSGLGLASAAVCWRRAWGRRRWAGLAAVGGITAALGVAAHWSGNGTQAEAAAALLEELGYAGVRRELLPGVGHEPAAGEVLGRFWPVGEGGR
jgi:poly(3-hydroxybutyrate) depolymerase